VGDGDGYGNIGDEVGGDVDYDHDSVGDGVCDDGVYNVFNVGVCAAGGCAGVVGGAGDGDDDEVGDECVEGIGCG